MAMPVGPLLCVIDGPTRGRPWASDSARAQLRRVAAKAGVRRRFPHQLRHARAVYLQGIDSAEIITTVHARQAPMTRRHQTPHLSRPRR
jgi:integrase